MLKLEALHHCGIMTNYECTAACRHCLYACSPERTGGYISEPVMDEVCKVLKKGKCGSVHIGGGEPFMNFDGLLALLRKLRDSGITVDYIETNGYWATDENQVGERLKKLSAAGADSLCISVDPFHAEYVPYSLPLNLANYCRKSGFGYFLWQEQFLPMLKNADGSTAHERATLEKYIPNYIRDTSQAYGLRMGGRAVNIEKEYSTLKPLKDLLLTPRQSFASQNFDTPLGKGVTPPSQANNLIGGVITSEPCRGLISTNHFHIDMYGRFIPPGCTGFAIPMNEMMEGLPAGKYPAFEILFSSGIKGLADFATQTKGFTPEPQGYTSRCALCFHIRRWLAKHGDCPELDLEHYEHSLRYYD